MTRFGFLYKWLFPLLLAIGLILIVRQWGIASYRISTLSMEEALHEGDFVLVNKLNTADNPGRNRVVLFMDPLAGDSVDTPLLVSRSIGMPGDTLAVDAEGYLLNGKRIPLSPHSLQTWEIRERSKDLCLKTMQSLHITLRDLKQTEQGYSLCLTPLEVAQINQEMPAGTYLFRNTAVPYQVIVPRRGRAYRLDEYSLPFCKEAIIKETGGAAKFKDNKLYLDGKETSFFFFRQDYYWMLSDNPNEAVDSRFLGIIPADRVIGNVWFCWYSNDKNRIFTRVN